MNAATRSADITGYGCSSCCADVGRTPATPPAPRQTIRRLRRDSTRQTRQALHDDFSHCTMPRTEYYRGAHPLCVVRCSLAGSRARAAAPMPALIAPVPSPAYTRSVRSSPRSTVTAWPRKFDAIAVEREAEGAAARRDLPGDESPSGRDWRLQYGVRQQCAEPVTGSSSMPEPGAKKRETKSHPGVEARGW